MRGPAKRHVAIRSVHATDEPIVNLGDAASADRILSDSYSEDRPQLAIRDLGSGPKGLHRAVGSQVIYNRRSGESVFFGALTSERLLTIFHLKETGAGSSASILSYDVDSTGTTESLKGESLKLSPAAEQVELKLRVNPGESLASESLMFAVGTDYHAQLEQYGRTVRLLHKARVGGATPIGWWSWTAYYFGLNEGSAGTNAAWLAENLKKSGYTYFQIDEGYQYARGEYTTADAQLFPLGMAHIADLVRHDGLTFGLWTAPFEVSERAWVYQYHNEWLVHNAAGALIHIGYVTGKNDPLYVLDTTNPGAQEYLRQTYDIEHETRRSADDVRGDEPSAAREGFDPIVPGAGLSATERTAASHPVHTGTDRRRRGRARVRGQQRECRDRAAQYRRRRTDIGLQPYQLPGCRQSTRHNSAICIHRARHSTRMKPRSPATSRGSGALRYRPTLAITSARASSKPGHRSRELWRELKAALLPGESPLWLSPGLTLELPAP